jgi:UTP--glucose-1-phosphate uridylyltransferase
MITGRNKRALEDHFDRVPVTEQLLAAKGDTEKLAAIQHATDLGEIHYVRQGDPKGLGHAVLRAKTHVGNEPFAVLLGDDLIDERDELLTTMIDVQARTGGSVIALIEVPRDKISAYGCADMTVVEGENYVKVNHLVEKPAVEDAPSNLAVIGRYVLHPAVFEVLENTPPGRGDEIQLTDALQTLATREGDGGGVYGVVFRGRRYDTGNRLEYVKAVVQFAERHAEIGAEFSGWLREHVAAAGGNSG